MQFKVKEISVKVSFSFLALILYFIVTDNIRIYLITLFSAIVHESVHIIVIYLFKGNIKSIVFSASGGNIGRETSLDFSFLKEAMVNVSAPVINIILGIVFCYWGSALKDFSIVNFMLGAFNLLPFHSFDGGRFLENILMYFFDYKKVKVVTDSISVLVAVFFTIVSILIFVKYEKNYFLILFSLYMILSIILDY